MLNIQKYIFASSFSEAYDILTTQPNSVILGGCGYLRLNNRNIPIAIDLSKLGIDQINETDFFIEIGAMTTLRNIETSTLLHKIGNGVFNTSVKNIVGVQLRSCVTAGGTVAGRYPFSDLITALLALDVSLSFYHAGVVKLEDYLDNKQPKDVLQKILIPKVNVSAAYASIRKTQTDYSVLNTAVAKLENSFRIVVGSRPGKPTNLKEAADHLSASGFNPSTIDETVQIAIKTVKLGSNPRGSKEYRTAICPVLLQRTLNEVLNAA